MSREPRTPASIWRHLNIETADGCWEFAHAGSLTTAGYGQLWVDGRLRMAHRLAWESSCGPIPDGLVLDHLCRNRRCCNPTHLEPVTQRENVLRGEGVAARYSQRATCPQGHPLTPDPTRGRRCRPCRNDHERNRKRDLVGVA